MYPDTNATVYRVSGGERTRWFFGEEDAREFARDRFDDSDGPIPFVEKLTLAEALVRLNELEAS